MGSEVKDITDDLPFEIPNNWVWCRLNDIIILISGTDLSPDKYNSNNKGIPYITGASNFINSILNINRWTEHPTTISDKGDLLITCKGTIGEMAYNNVGVIHIARQVMAIRSLYHFVSYIRILLETYITSLKKAAKSMIPGISRQDILQCYFPLPPLAEQVRIVAEIEKFEPLIAEYNKLEQQATKLDEEIYDKLKKSILQYAIQGKLVPQDPNDEPASVLLERIRAEKKAKLGKKYVDSYIYKGDDNCYYEKVGTKEPVCLDNLPFDIPDSWCWTRLENAVAINPRNNLSDNLEISFVEMKAISDGYNNQFTAINRLWNAVKSSFTHFQDGDVGFAKITPCFQNRKSVVFTDLRNGYGAGTTELHILRPLQSTILPKYLLCFVKSPYFIEHGKQKFSGTAGQQRFGTDEVKKTLLPLPPLAEQKRIVNQVELILRKLKDED